MISLIVCSSSSHFYSIFSKSVAESVGCVYEIIKIDNYDSKYSITQAYDLGASKAKWNILVFLHEDVVFHSKNWGNELIRYFNTLKNPGVLGIAGSSYLPISPSDWWLSDRQYLHSYFLSNKKDGKVGEGVLTSYGQQVPKIVYALDGMFLAIKKNIYQEFSFNTSLSGFHGYDTAICYQVSQKYHNYFVPGILLEHFSKGYPNETWLKNTIAANQSVLSFFIEKKKLGFLDSSLEIKSYHLFLRQLMKFSSSTSYKFSNAWKYLFPVFKFTKDWRIFLFFFTFCFRYSLNIFRLK